MTREARSTPQRLRKAPTTPPPNRHNFPLNPSGGGTQLWVTRHVPPKRPYFFRSLSPKDPHFQQLSPNDPLFFENFDIFDEMLRTFWPFWPWKTLFFDAFHWKTPYFCALCHWKTPFFDALFWCNLSPKDPYIWGAWWHSYVTFICECPPGTPPYPHFDPQEKNCIDHTACVIIGLTLCATFS